jgi:hypothetical protein
MFAFNLFQDGLSALFRGLSAPALFSTPRFALIFYSNAHSRKQVKGKLGEKFESERKSVFSRCCFLSGLMTF